MKKTKNKIRIAILVLAGILIVGFGVYNTADAADRSVYISPASLNKKVGDVFDISVKVNPSGQKVCVVEGKLNLNKLSCQDVTMGSDISAQTLPSCDNLSFLLGIQGCTTDNKTLFTVTVRAKNAGSGTANFTGVDIIGEGVSISSSSSGGSYAITSTPSCNCNAWASWQNGTCGGGSCSSTQRLQTRTRTCTPSGCDADSESRCIDDSNCVIVSGEQEVSEEPEEVVSEEEKPELPAKKEKRVIPVRETHQESLSASLIMALGKISESSILTTIVTLCLVVLALVGFREWTLFQEKKKK